MKFPQERIIEICNAVNGAVAADKIVTIDSPGIIHAIQIAGAFPNCGGLVFVKHMNWDDRDHVPILWFDDKYTIRAYLQSGASMEIIHKPNGVEEILLPGR